VTNSTLDPHVLGVLIAAPFVGSFLATLAVQLPVREQAVLGRSRCRMCGHTLGIADLVPLGSWLVQRGRCRHCGGAIGRLYPLVELAAIAIAVWAAIVMDGWLLWVTCGLGWALLTLAVIDTRHFMLPDALTLPLIGAGLLTAFGLGPALVPAHAAGALAGFAVFAALRWVYRRLRSADAAAPIMKLEK
jgi:leader peptidase (prepilin peptidase)/N-methyltransferase